jgi:iron complex outermembrane receptor protein
VVYGNASTGFEAPTLGEVRLPAGFNEEVKPQTAVSLEAGVRRGTGRVSFDLSFFRMIVDDEILPATIDNVTVYRNVARAGHTGIEASARARMSSWLTLDGTYAYSRFTLDDFVEFSGNRLPGVPAHAGTVGASVVTPQGLELHGSLTAAGAAFVNSANTEWADAYGVVSASAAYRFRRVRVFGRWDNLGGVRYTNRIQVDDASGFYYYPAPGSNGTVGVEVSW